MTPEEITDAMNLIKRSMERNDKQLDELRSRIAVLEDAQRGYRNNLTELTEAWHEATRHVS